MSRAIRLIARAVLTLVVVPLVLMLCVTMVVAACLAELAGEGHKP